MEKLIKFISAVYFGMEKNVDKPFYKLSNNRGNWVSPRPITPPFALATSISALSRWIWVGVAGPATSALPLLFLNQICACVKISLLVKREKREKFATAAFGSPQRVQTADSFLQRGNPFLCVILNSFRRRKSKCFPLFCADLKLYLFPLFFARHGVRVPGLMPPPFKCSTPWPLPQKRYARVRRVVENQDWGSGRSHQWRGCGGCRAIPRSICSKSSLFK